MSADSLIALIEGQKITVNESGQIYEATDCFNAGINAAIEIIRQYTAAPDVEQVFKALSPWFQPIEGNAHIQQQMAAARAAINAMGEAAPCGVLSREEDRQKPCPSPTQLVSSEISDTDDDIALAEKYLTDLCRSGGRSWCLTIPAQQNDVDLVFQRVINRAKATKQVSVSLNNMRFKGTTGNYELGYNDCLLDMKNRLEAAGVKYHE